MHAASLPPPCPLCARARAPAGLCGSRALAARGEGVHLKHATLVTLPVNPLVTTLVTTPITTPALQWNQYK